MTTIIAKNRELIADRRQVVNAAATGIIGVRDEGKIHKLPYCLYGMCGFEMTDIGPRIDPIVFQQSIATICALTAFANDASNSDKRIDQIFLEQSGWTEEQYENFQRHARLMRDIIAEQFSTDLWNHGQGLLIMTHQAVMMLNEGKFAVYSVKEPVVLGSGVTMVQILLDHGISCEEIYPMLRRHGVPTGTTFDVFSLDKDLPFAMPPMSNTTMLVYISIYIRRSLRSSLKSGKITKETRIESLCMLVENIARFMALGKVSRNKWIFNKKSIPEINSVEIIHKNKTLIEKACSIAKVKYQTFLTDVEKKEKKA